MDMSILIPDWAEWVAIRKVRDGEVEIKCFMSDPGAVPGAGWGWSRTEDFMKAHGIAFIKQQIRDKPLSERIEHDPALRYKPGRHSVYVSPDSKPQSKYHKEIKPGVIVDWYDVAAAFSPKPSKMWEKVCGAVHHAHKKLCRLGSGDKELRQDLVEARDSLDRAIEQFDTWA